MKVIISLIFAISITTTWSQSTIDLQCENSANDSVYLAYYFGSSQYIKDTLVLDANGHIKWDAGEKLPGGAYMIVFPNQSNQYFEFLWDGKPIKLTVTETDVHPELIISGNKNAEKYREYSSRLQEYTREKERIEKEKAESMADQLNALNEEAYGYILDQIESNKNNLFGKFIKFNQDISIPEDISEEGNARFYYYRDHFFDHTPFNDPWLIYTPGYVSKIETYLEKLTAKHQDSIIESIDFILSQINEGTENYKYTVVTLFNKYASSKAMYAGNIYTHMAEKYYLSGKAFWADEKQLSQIRDRYNSLRYNDLGDVIQNITVESISGEQVPLHEQCNNNYTILFFWSEDVVGRSKKVASDLVSYSKEMSDKVGIVGVQTNIDAFVRIGLATAVGAIESSWSNFQILHDNDKIKFDVNDGVVLYLLDKDKRILAKRISVDQIKQYIENDMKRP